MVNKSKNSVFCVQLFFDELPFQDGGCHFFGNDLHEKAPAVRPGQLQYLNLSRLQFQAFYLLIDKFYFLRG
jgi:hypothetical protein